MLIVDLKKKIWKMLVASNSHDDVRYDAGCDMNLIQIG